MTRHERLALELVLGAGALLATVATLLAMGSLMSPYGL